jgi:hypothetical protein
MVSSNYKITKKSQVTIFIIIAILIVGLIALFFTPQFKNLFLPKSPGQLIPKACVEKVTRDILNQTMMHGGKLNPTIYFMYNNYSLDYLCYTSEWYKACVMQNPLIRQSIEKQVETASTGGIMECINDMENKLKSQGYEVSIQGSKIPTIEINPDKIKINFNFNMTLQKPDSSIENIPSSRFKTEFDSKYYDLIIISTSILNYEARFGDSYPETFATFYPSLKIEKLKQDDGTKVYILTNRDTGEKFQFATRSLAWPPGLARPLQFATTV